MSSKDYYRVLGIQPTANAKEIKNAYRGLAFKYHPDRNKDNTDAVNQMKAVNEAYAVLSDEAKRREYDAIRTQFGSAAHDRFRRNYSEEDIFAGSDIFRVFEELTRLHGFRHYEEVFKEFYGPGYRSFEVKRPGMFFKGFVFTGRPGSGRGPRRRRHAGPGLGRLGRRMAERLLGARLPQRGKDVDTVIRLSPEEARNGGPYAYLYRQQQKKLIVKIPPNVRENQRIRLAGLGEPGRGGAEPGDLYLQVAIDRPILAAVKSKIKRWLKG
jgi:DnaJ-class molecular chaperone